MVWEGFRKIDFKIFSLLLVTFTGMEGLEVDSMI